MTRRRTLLIVAFAAACTACGTAMRAVPFDASPATWESLAGDWRGEYTMTGHDRRGLIAFRLQAAPQQATGDVLMIPEHHAWPYGPRRGGAQAAAREIDQSELLSIRFVSAQDGRLRGTMAPYWDPDRQCQATASFAGVRQGSVIEGTFTTVCEDGVRTASGHWRVERKP